VSRIYLAAAALLLGFSAAAGFTQDNYPAATPLETERVTQRFERAAAMSYMPGRSGDLFFLPRKYYFVTFDSGNYAHDGHSHLLRQGKETQITHGGSSHGQVWDYDVHIPLWFYGPGFVKAGQTLPVPATQQDLVPTYAALIGAIPPEDSKHGQVLQEVFSAAPMGSRKPKAILTLVFDQGGHQYYAAHPGVTPRLDNYRRQGTTLSEARVTHLDVETSIGHIAIGTGAYPYQHGIVSNSFFLAPYGRRSSLLGDDRSPIFINSASLADVWDKQQGNRPVIISYAYADRAAIGMAGHGAMYSGGDHDTVVYYDDKKGIPTTNTRYYHLPPYLSQMSMAPYLERLLKGGTWHGHDVNNFSDITKTPAQVWFDRDVVLKMIAQEPIGQDDVPDLVYITLKATDACGHAFGYETLECRDVLAAQDQAAAEIILAMERKVGKDQLLTVVTADHGGAPLAELSGGQRISANDFKAALNQALDRIDNGVPIIHDMSASQLYINDSEMVRNGLTWEDIRHFTENYTLNGVKPFLRVLTKQEVVAEQQKLGL
jgi:predicted AlkP superfamily pyrophosphatase or phosphodiesterase